MRETKNSSALEDGDVTGEDPDSRNGAVRFLEDIVEKIMGKLHDKSFQKQVVWSMGSIILALVIAAVILSRAGFDPGLAYAWLAVGAFSQMDQVLFYATPLIITGLSVALAFKCGLFNIGAEGQLYIGSMAAVLIAYQWSLPFVLHPLVALMAGAGAGFVWGFVPGLLKAYRGAHEVVTTMMLSYTAILFTGWLVSQNGPFWDGSMVPRTPPIADTAILPVFFGDYLHVGFFVAIAAVIGVNFLINKTVLGYELRAVGQNVDAAEYGGISSKKNVALAMGISGGLAGLAGAEEMLGNISYQRFVSGWSPGLGWDGITVAVLGNNSPWGVFAGAVFFGALRTGGNTMNQMAGVPNEVVKLIQGLVVLFIAAPRVVSWFVDRGMEHASEGKKKPQKSMAYLLPAVFGLAVVLLSLDATHYALVLPLELTWINGIVLLVFLGLSCLGLITFGWFYARNPRAPRALLILSIIWALAGALDFAGGGGCLLPSLMVAGVGFLMWAIHRILLKLDFTLGEDKEEGAIQ